MERRGLHAVWLCPRRSDHIKAGKAELRVHGSARLFSRTCKVEQRLPNHLHVRQLDLGQCVVAQLGRNVRQPNCVLANWIAAHKAEWRPGAGEEGLASTQHDGVEIEAILINKTKVGQASRQVWSADCNLPNVLLLLAPPRRRELAFLRAPLRTVFIPIAHNRVQAATVHAARQAAHLIYEVAKKRWARRRKFLMIDVAIQGLVHSEDELSHATKSPPRFFRIA